MTVTYFADSYNSGVYDLYGVIPLIINTQHKINMHTHTSGYMHKHNIYVQTLTSLSVPDISTEYSVKKIK